MLLCEWFFTLFEKDKIEEELQEEHKFWHQVIKTMLIRFMHQDADLQDDVKKALKNVNTMLNPFIEYFDPPPPEDDTPIEKETRRAGRQFVEMFAHFAGIVMASKTGAVIKDTPSLWRSNLEEHFLCWSVFSRIASMSRENAKPYVVDIIFETLPVLYTMKKDSVAGAAMRLGIHLDLVHAFFNEWITEEMIENLIGNPVSSSDDDDGSSEDDEQDAPPVIA